MRVTSLWLRGQFTPTLEDDAILAILPMFGSSTRVSKEKVVMWWKPSWRTGCLGTCSPLVEDGLNLHVFSLAIEEGLRLR